MQLKRKPHMRKTVAASFEDEFGAGTASSAINDKVAIQYMLGTQLVNHFRGGKQVVDP